MGNKQLGRVTISRGDLLGRKIPFTEQEGLRPTSSRVREAVFSMLAGLVEEGYGFLDVCAGSGVMGFTAGGCGFSPVLLVESDKDTFAELERTKAALKAPVALHQGNALQVRKLQLPEGLWICYADPPFQDRKFHGKCMARLAELEAFQIDSLYVAEHEHPLEPGPGFELVKQKKYGRTYISLFRLNERIQPPSEG